jgi:prepilin-type N-terminal cleavage/methylation domain-containing protein
MSKSRTAKTRLNRGLTLVECCTVLAIVSLLATSAWPAMTDWFSRARLEGRSQELMGDLSILRSLAISTNQDMRLSVHSDESGSCYVIHSGPRSACGCRSDGAAWCTDPSSAPVKAVGFEDQEGIRLAANIKSILFDPRLGTASPSGTLRLEDSGGRELRHVVSIRGRLRTCASGYEASASGPCDK